MNIPKNGKHPQHQIKLPAPHNNGFVCKSTEIIPPSTMPDGQLIPGSMMLVFLLEPTFSLLASRIIHPKKPIDNTMRLAIPSVFVIIRT